MDNMPENTNEVINKNANEAATTVEAPKKKNKKGLLIGIFAVLALIIVASLFTDGDKLAEHDYIIAENKKAIYLIDAANPQTEPVMIDEITGDGGYVAEHYINKDKTKLLYANKAHEDKENFDIYYELWLYDIASGEKSLIDENVYMHCVNEAFDTVTYFKGEEGELWQKKTDGEAVKLYDGLVDAWVSDDLQTIIYTDMDKNTYAKEADAEPVLLGNEISAMDSSDNAILFSEGKKLVKYENGEKKIISDKFSETTNMVYYDYAVTLEGGYFLTEKEMIDIEGCFVDDMEESDKNIKPSDVEAYAEKLVRDALRLELAASKEWSMSVCDLYYYDGNEAVLVCENVIEALENASYYSNEDDGTVAAYMVLGEYELPKLVMSEFYEEFEEEYSSLSQVYYDALKQQSTVGFAKGGKHIGTAEIEGAMNYVYDSANTTVYVLTEKLGDGGEFDFIESYYTVKFGEDGISESELYVEDVSSEITEVVDGKLLYGKYDDEDEYMYIYKGEELIAERVAFTQWLETDMLYVGIEGETEDIPGQIYSDGKFTEYDGLENYEMSFATEKGNIICYDYNEKGSQIVVGKDGKLTAVAGGGKFIDVYVPFEYDNGYELASPLFFGSLFAP